MNLEERARDQAIIDDLRAEVERLKVSLEEAEKTCLWHRKNLNQKITRLRAALEELLRQFHEKAHPGHPARKAMVSEKRLSEYRKALAGREESDGRTK